MHPLSGTICTIFTIFTVQVFLHHRIESTLAKATLCCSQLWSLVTSAKHWRKLCDPSLWALFACHPSMPRCKTNITILLLLLNPKPYLLPSHQLLFWILPFPFVVAHMVLMCPYNSSSLWTLIQETSILPYTFVALQTHVLSTTHHLT